MTRVPAQAQSSAAEGRDELLVAPYGLIPRQYSRKSRSAGPLGPVLALKVSKANH